MSPERGRFLGGTRTSACASRTLTTFPSSFFQRAPVVVGASACRGTSPATDATDRPRPALFRQPAKATGIPRIGVPSTAAFARAWRISPPVSRGRPLAHAAHTESSWRKTECFEGIASLTSGTSPAREVDSRERGRLFNLVRERFCRLALASPRLGLTTQARQRGSVCVAFRES